MVGPCLEEQTSLGPAGFFLSSARRRAEERRQRVGGVEQARREGGRREGGSGGLYHGRSELRAERCHWSKVFKLEQGF